MSKEKKKLCRFFLYGTLKEGRPLDRPTLAKLRTKVQPATIEGSIFDLGWYPTIKLDGKGQVIGEVHTFPKEHVDDVRRMMDQIEGYRKDNPEKGLYNRHIIKAKLEDGSEVKAFVYEYNGKVGDDRRIEEGVWEPKD
jgi:gamma-glutamylcyclotransferase (GGCT)/AIG2-like uncharacterized protein YtfP